MVQGNLENIKKPYGATQVVHGLDLQIENGEFIVFVGPSGCGKPTFLRMIAGLEEIKNGDFWIGGERSNDNTPTERGVSMVF